MIDQGYQAEIDRNLDAQQFGPKGPAAGLPTWQNFGAGAGGLVAGPLQAGASWADILKGSGETLAATGTYSKGGMFSTPDAEEQRQNDAAATKIALQGPDTHSEVGTQLRTQAKDYLPDPQATGKAGQILGGLTTFASQAIPAGMAGPAGLVALGSARGVQKSAELEEQGVDQGTRTAAGLVSGTLDAASMVLPMTGTSRLIAAGKGAAGGVATSVAQTEAEKLILEHAGYDKLASTYDPFDPVSLALSGIVPAAFGGLHSPTTAKAPGAARAEPTHADVTLSPEEQAHSAQVEDSTIDVDIASLKQELGKQTDAGARQVLQAELDRLTARKAVLADPAALDAARVTQTAAAIDHSRLTPDDDIQGHEQHAQAVEAASDQIARGEPVEVSDVIGDREANFRRWFGESKIVDEGGQPKVMYHGTAQDFDSFKARQADAIFVGDHPVIAEAYADQSAKWMAQHGQEGAPSVTPLLVRAEHPFDYENPVHVDALAREILGSADGQKSQIRAQVERLLHAGDWDLIESPETQAAIKRLGHDAFYVNESGFKNLGVYDARNLKSAIGNSGRFDPASGSLTDPVRDFSHAVDQLRDAREAAREGPAIKAPHERASEEAAPRAPAAEKAPAPEGAAEHPGPEAAQLDATTAEVLRANPDLMVQLDGMEPMRAADLLEAVRQQAAEESRDASLLEVAAQCAISL